MNEVSAAGRARMLAGTVLPVRRREHPAVPRWTAAAAAWAPKRCCAHRKGAAVHIVAYNARDVISAAVLGQVPPDGGRPYRHMRTLPDHEREAQTCHPELHAGTSLLSAAPRDTKELTLAY